MKIEVPDAPTREVVRREVAARQGQRGVKLAWLVNGDQFLRWSMTTSSSAGNSTLSRNTGGFWFCGPRSRNQLRKWVSPLAERKQNANKTARSDR